MRSGSASGKKILSGSADREDVLTEIEKAVVQTVKTLIQVRDADNVHGIVEFMYYLVLIMLICLVLLLYCIILC